MEEGSQRGGRQRSSGAASFRFACGENMSRANARALAFGSATNGQKSSVNRKCIPQCHPEARKPQQQQKKTHKNTEPGACQQTLTPSNCNYDTPQHKSSKDTKTQNIWMGSRKFIIKDTHHMLTMSVWKNMYIIII